MRSRTTHQLSIKVAQKYMSKGLREHMQMSVSQARLELVTLKEMVARGVSLVEASTHKEHIYKEAGDLITRFEESLETMNTCMAEIGYVIGQMATTSNAQDLKPSARKTLDKLLQATHNVDPATLQGLPTLVEYISPALERTQAEYGSIHDVSEASDVAKRGGPRDIIDYTDMSLYLTKPDVEDGDVP